MKEWPTRVRTGVPPFSLTTSGTDQDVIRLWMTVPLPPCLARLAGGHQGGDGGRGDRVSALVDDEAAVRVAVEGDAEVGPLLADPLLEVDDVRRVEGVGLVVRERAVQFEVHRDDVQRQAREHRRDGVATHAVARVHDDLQGADRGQVDEGAQVGRVVVQCVPLRDRAGCRGRLRGARLAPPLDQFADLDEAGVLADRGRARPGHLDAVVLGGVVGGREHRARQVQRAGGVVQLVGRAQADLGDVHAAGGRSAREGPRQTRGRGPHVVAGHDRARPRHLDEGGTEKLGQRLVPLVGNDSAHVVRLHEL